MKLFQAILSVSLLTACAVDVGDERALDGGPARELGDGGQREIGKTAQALTERVIMPPAGYAGGRIFVGRRLSDSLIYVFYRKNYSGDNYFSDCNSFDNNESPSRWIGDANGLFDDKVKIYGSSGQDEALILTGAFDGDVESVCGLSFGNITDFGGGKIDLYTVDGDDLIRLDDTGGTGPAYRVSVYAGEGQDKIWVQQNANNVYGEAGSDVLIGHGAETPKASFFGGSGVDMFCGYGTVTAPWFDILYWDGGGSSDVRWGEALTMTSVEGSTAQGNCDIHTAQISSRMGDD